jgi:phospholipase C
VCAVFSHFNDKAGEISVRYVTTLATLLSVLFTARSWAQPAPFKHIIIIVQENRTPDNLFGSNPAFEPGVDIAASGVSSTGQTVPLTAELLNGCYDPSHSHTEFLTLYDNGKMDGGNLVKVHRNSKTCEIPTDPVFKFATNAGGQVQPYFDIATQYGFANRMFQTNQGPSFPAHQFLFGGTSAPDETSTLFASENMLKKRAASGCIAPNDQRVTVIDPAGSESSNPPVYPCFNRPTMANLLDDARLSWMYYLNDKRADGIWNAPAAIKDVCGAKKFGKKRKCDGSGYVRHITNERAEVLRDIRACSLPAVSWVIPDAADSDHAGANKGGGPDWVGSIVNSIGQAATCPHGESYWNDTAIFVTWDDWGGWYDHVPPYHIGGWGGTHDWGAGYTYGMRVPLLVISAYTKAGYVDNTPQDFGSILKFTESNFNLPTIGPGYYADAYAGDLSGFFSLTAPRAFQKIDAMLDADYFMYREERSSLPVDDD